MSSYFYRNTVEKKIHSVIAKCIETQYIDMETRIVLEIYKFKRDDEWIKAKDKPKKSVLYKNIDIKKGDFGFFNIIEIERAELICYKFKKYN